MAGIINDYETLRKFRDDLDVTVKNLRAQLKQTDRAMEEVAAVWKDMQFKKFDREFGKDKEEIEPLCKKFEDFDQDVLYPLQKILEDYGDQ